MLYAYLKHFGGICASHTSATGMGTDWRDNDPLVEPVVEIYQGDRNNYECEGAPRGLTAATCGGPARTTRRSIPKGFIWNALAKGYRLGFESSSDHISTHASYAVVLVEKPGREAIVEAFRARRCFAATDNIGLVVKCADHLMGEEFPLGRPADAGNPRRGNRADHPAGHRPQQSLRLQRHAQPRDPRPEMDRRRSAARAGQLLLRPHRAGRRQPGLELADVDPSATGVTTRGGSSGR